MDDFVAAVQRLRLAEVVSVFLYVQVSLRNYHIRELRS